MSLRSAPDWLTKWEYAHRGLHSDGVPENSLAAAEAAIAAGLGLECDIQRSRDGVPMVFHDWEVDRLTEGEGETESLLADELERLSLNGTDQSPVRLARFLEQVGGRVPLLIEIKSKPGYNPDPTSFAVHHALSGYRGQFAVMSFDPRVAIWFKANAQEICSGLVMREDKYGYTQTAAERGEALRAAEPDFLAYHVLALPNDRVAALRADGLPVLTWTVNSPETRAVAAAHADAMISEGAGLLSAQMVQQPAN